MNDTSELLVNVDLIMTHLTPYGRSFALYMITKTLHTPLQIGVNFISRKSDTYSLHAIELIVKFHHYCLACLLLQNVQICYVCKAVLECQVWLLFMAKPASHLANFYCQHQFLGIDNNEHVLSVMCSSSQLTTVVASNNYILTTTSKKVIH